MKRFESIEDMADSVAEVVGAIRHTSDLGTIKVYVERERWREAVTAARDQAELPFFSWLSAVDWTNEVVVGDPPAEEVEERYEVMCAVSNITDGQIVILSADVPKDDPVIDSVMSVYPGADWHEREAAEMFELDFAGHPNLVKLYLTSDFVGHPLKKSYALISREVKPWPGTVDVEDMPEKPVSDAPSYENPDA
ncbi:MAG: NADH-quinone oxidoreductase subunit C [Acidimicrobiia bacterium]|nr:NADH-quinone oxidoreductase subunit C [Acidimicrobiia bacterium]